MSEPATSKAERRRGTYRWRASPLLLIVIIGVVTTTGAFTGISLHREADASHHIQVELATLLEHAHHLGHLEWKAVAQEAVRPALREEMNATRRDMERMLGSLEQAHPGDEGLAEVRKTYDRYSSAMTEEFRLLAAGRKAEAEKLDVERVDPLFMKLSETIRRQVATEERLTAKKTRVADVGTAVMAFMAFVFVALLLRGFDRARQAVVAAATEKRVTEQSEERFRQVAESADEWIWEVDADGLYTYCSPAVERILGYGPEEVVGKKHFYDLFAPDMREELKKAALDAFGRKEAFKNFANPNVHKNGGIVILETSGMPILNEHGALTGYRGADTDITERKRAEEALAASEEQHRTMIEHSNDLIWTLDIQGDFTYVNKVAEEVSGYKSEDLMGRNFAPMVPPEDLSRIEEMFLDTLAGNTRQYTVDVRGKDGSLFVLAVNSAPVFESGEVVGTVSFGRDITEQERARVALHESESKYRTLFERSPDGVLLIDAETALPIEFNDAACRQLGYSREEFARLRIGDYEAQEAPKETQARMEKILREGRDEFETLHRAKSGEICNVIVTVQTLESSGRYLFYSIYHDITERKQAEQLKSDVVAMVSHDLRSPLAVVAGNAMLLERLLEQTSGPEPALNAVRKIKERAESMAQMVKRMLDLSQIDAGTFALALDTVDVGDIVARAAESVPLTDKHVLEVDVAPDLPLVRCDSERLSMVVTNLVSNAVKFSPEGGEIGVSVRQEAERALVSVADEGVGIAPEDRSRIFERFGRGEAATVRSVSGAGIGLYLSRKTVEAHSGRIEVESEPGKGSTFTIEIPIEQPQVESTPGSESPAA